MDQVQFAHISSINLRMLFYRLSIAIHTWYSQYHLYSSSKVVDNSSIFNRTHVDSSPEASGYLTDGSTINYRQLDHSRLKANRLILSSSSKVCQKIVVSSSVITRRMLVHSQLIGRQELVDRSLGASRCPGMNELSSIDRSMKVFRWLFRSSSIAIRYLVD